MEMIRFLQKDYNSVDSEMFYKEKCNYTMYRNKSFRDIYRVYCIEIQLGACSLISRGRYFVRFKFCLNYLPQHFLVTEHYTRITRVL